MEIVGKGRGVLVKERKGDSVGGFFANKWIISYDLLTETGDHIDTSRFSVFTY